MQYCTNLFLKFSSRDIQPNCHITAINTSLEYNLKNHLKNCYCIQLSSWRIDRYLPQLAVFIRFVSPDFVVKEELLDLFSSTQESTRGVDIKNALDSIMKTFDVILNKLVSIALMELRQFWVKNQSYWAFKRWFSNSTFHTV